MSFDPLTLAILSAAAPVVKTAYESLKEYLEKKRSGEQEQAIIVAGRHIDSDEVTPELVETLRSATEVSQQVHSNPFTLARRAIRESKVEVLGGEELPPVAPPNAEVAAVALAISPEAVFRDARRRVDLVFRLNVGILVTLAIILLIGVAGSIFSAVFLQKEIWALVFGGVSVADLIGVYFFKPLTAINVALVSTQRLDTLYLRLREQLKACEEHQKLVTRIKCQTNVWKAINEELVSLQMLR